MRSASSLVAGRAPEPDLEAEARHGAIVRDLIRGGLATTAHDVSDGGLAVAAAELCFGFSPGLGIAIEHRDGDPPHGALFGEDGARYLLVVPETALEAVGARLDTSGVAWRVAGRVTPDPAIRIGRLDAGREHLQRLWEDSIEERMERLEDER